MVEHRSRAGGVATATVVAFAAFVGGARAQPEAWEGGDPTSGKAIFVRICHTCHSNRPDVDRIGPSLFGVVGRRACIKADYPYSEAMRNSGYTWTPERIFAYIFNPQQIIPGVKMHYQGLPHAADRRDIIAYLETLHD